MCRRSFVTTKYKEVPNDGWLTFREAFDYANHNLADQTVCLANLDIFLDADDTDWHKAAEFVRSPLVFCLSRIEVDSANNKWEDEELARVLFAWEPWMFEALFAPIEVPDCDFDIGTMGCDNAQRAYQAWRTITGQ